MKKVLFDTNIYGLLVERPDWKSIELYLKRIVIIYGFSPIRKELRNISVDTPVARKSRILLLSLYDRMTKNHAFEITSSILRLALSYYQYYKLCGGTYNWRTSISVDFLIVACASMNDIDIVYSADNKTLKSNSARAAYKHINSKKGLKTPEFLDFENIMMTYRESLL